ncbi:hypothetical protein LCGC14_1909140 [marine sediment metagenome]|uniref:Uncharacterized protein n=1 Tax=marine sediment metagenome TaxID=412755 RepID=A0A0F9I852_9ZZZZ
MEIGLYNIDSKMPNYVLMKISTWHKSQSDTVNWYSPVEAPLFDKVYASSIFTWTQPPIFSMRRRMVVNHLIAERDMIVEAMEERFNTYNALEFGSDESKINLSHWGDPGRYEKHLKVTVRPTQKFYASKPGIVFTHPDAFGYVSRGKKKLLGKERTDWLPDWGTAAEIMGQYYQEGQNT